MTVARVILVSDTHLSPASPEALANWEAVLGYVALAAPDVVIRLGDLTLDGAHDAGQLAYGREQLDRLPVPWHAVPGNHDIGDNPWPGAPPGSTVDTGRHQRWRDIVGPDQWSLTTEGWMLLGINAQLLGSGLWAQGRARHRLAGVLASSPPVLVLSGHVHQFRQLRLHGTDHLWVPTTWAVLPDHAQPVLGAKRCGIVALTFAEGAPPQPQLIEPDGIAQLTLTKDLPDPYHG